MKRNLIYYGNPILRKRSREVTVINQAIHELVADMTDTLIAYNGIGLAAPQVGISKRIFITAVPNEQPDGSWLPGQLRVFINPQILEFSKATACRSEGCLSIPKLYAEVERPKTIRVQAQDLNGNLFEKEFSGLEARCILHENDHINGILFIDRIPQKEREKIELYLKEIKQNLPPIEESPKKR